MKHTAQTDGGLMAAYTAYFAYLGITTPFFPLWLAWRGLTAHDIATTGAAVMLGGTIGQLVLPYGALFSGARTMAAIATLCGMLTTALLAKLSAANSILLVAMIAGVFSGALIPLADALAIARSDADYGKVRAAGSVGFGVANLAGGWAIDRLGPAAVVPIEAALLGAMLVAILTVQSVSPIPVRRNVAPRGEVWATLRRMDVWMLVVAVAAINASHAYYYLFANLHWTAQLGYSVTTTGALWATGVVAEVTVLAAFGKRRGLRWAVGLLLAGAGAGVLRWGGSAFDPPLVIIFALQLLHGGTFGATILGGMEALRVLVPPGAAPAILGVFAAMVHGVVIGGVTMLLGDHYDSVGGHGFLLMAAMAAIGGLLTFGFALIVARQRRVTTGLARLST